MFKTKQDFFDYGFSGKGPYKKWLSEIERLTTYYPGIMQIQCNLLFDELRSLGFQYLQTKGSDNDFTKQRMNQFNNTLKELQ